MSGNDPIAHRQVERKADDDTFEAIAREWFAKFKRGCAESHSEKVIRRLELYVFPWIGKKPISKVLPTDITACVKRLEDRTLDTAHRALNNIGQVFRYAVANGRAARDPKPDLRGSIQSLSKQHYAAITDPAEVGALLRAVDGFAGTFPTKCALKLAPLWFVRPGEIRAAEWSEFNLDDALWTIPPVRRKLTKKKKDDPSTQPHVVPLSTQAIAILRELQPLTGNGKFLFPGARSLRVPMSDNILNAAIRRLGYERDTMTTHGFRAMARTILDEHLGFRVDIIAHQLAHEVKDPLGRAYNRTTHLPERRRMMQAWADYLDGLRASVVPVAK